MVNGAAARLCQLCVALNLAVPDLARLLAYPPERLRCLLGGQGRVSGKLLADVLEQFPALTPRWLLAGEGPMFRVLPHTDNQLGANYGYNVQIINHPCSCRCDLNLLQNHLREKERVIQLLLQLLPTPLPIS